MKQDDGYNKEFTDKVNESSESAIEGREGWLNEHGQPDFEYLQSLATDGGPEALEKLQAIAEDLNVEYDPTTSIEDLVAKIISATETNEDDRSNMTV